MEEGWYESPGRLVQDLAGVKGNFPVILTKDINPYFFCIAFDPRLASRELETNHYFHCLP